MKKAFTTLQLSDKKKINNIYSLMFDKKDDWFTKIQNLYGKVLT